MIKGTTKIFGIIGDPVEHSKSPNMHNYAFRKYNIDAVYVPFNVSKKHIRYAVSGLRALNISGINVTMPHKQTIIRHLDSISEESKLLGAVNTVINKSGKLHGTTTDPYGIIMPIKKNRLDIRKSRVTILGNGGAARTTLFTLHLNKCQNIALAVRNMKKGKTLSDQFKSVFKKSINVYSLNSKAFAERLGKTNLLINCTSVGMSPNKNSSPVLEKYLHNKITVFDMVYSPHRTKLIKDAEFCGSNIIYGIEMLVYQGMYSFELWTGQKPEYDIFYKKAIKK